MKYVIDTHVLIWFLTGSSQLSDAAKLVFVNDENKFILPVTALAEAVWVVSRGKTTIPSVEVLLEALRRDPQMTIYPMDQTIVERTVGLFAINEMHDRQIVATALVIQESGEEVALVTCDRNITESNLVSIVW